MYSRQPTLLIDLDGGLSNYHSPAIGKIGCLSMRLSVKTRLR